jgi:FMN-dependent NADH-azoreductase
MTKVDEQIIEKFREAQKQMNQIQMELGAIALAKISEEFLLQEFKRNKNIVDELVGEIRDIHGDGTVDIDSGEFTPSEP